MVLYSSLLSHPHKQRRVYSPILVKVRVLALNHPAKMVPKYYANDQSFAELIAFPASCRTRANLSRTPCSLYRACYLCLVVSGTVVMSAGVITYSHDWHTSYSFPGVIISDSLIYLTYLFMVVEYYLRFSPLAITLH